MARNILYGFDGSTYARTVRMLLAEKQAQYEQVPVHVLKGEPRQPEHLARWSGWRATTCFRTSSVARTKVQGSRRSPPAGLCCRN